MSSLCNDIHLRMRTHESAARCGPGAVVRGLLPQPHSPRERCPVRSSDQTGAPLPGVRMTIRGVVDRAADTGAAGDFAFPDLPEGDYEISAELSGFEPARRAVRVQAGERVTRVLHPARRHRGRNDRHGREGGRARRSRRFPWRSVPSRTPSSARLGTQTLGQAAALAPSVTLSQNTGFGQLTIRGIGANVRVRRVGSELGDVPRRRLPRSTGDGVRAVSRSRSHRSASRTAGHACTDATRSVGR